jgi:tetratricopeptide (TPR) repeat protein
MHQRTVEVWCQGGYGSGYLVDRRHIITALHVIAEGVRSPEKVFQQTPGRIRVRKDLQVRLSGGTQWSHCQLIWPSLDDCAQHDIALLELSEDEAAGVEPTRWGRITTSTPQLSCEFSGFPRVQRYPTADPATVVSASEHMSGTMNLYTGLKAGYTFIYPAHNLADASAWQGFSGAGVLCGGLLTGIIVGQQIEQGRVLATPIVSVVSDPSFRRALQDEIEPLFAESVELSSFGRTPQPVQISHRKSVDSVASLLRADEQAIDFRGRTDELQKLLTWCEGTGFSIQLLTGPGGIGKTRLAQELASRLSGSNQNWTCTFLGKVSQSDSLGEAITRISTPTLLILDYAETLPRTTSHDPGQIEQIITAAIGRDSSEPLRILLVARSAGDWWEQIKSSTPGLATSPDAIGTIILPLLSESVEFRRNFYVDTRRNLRARIEQIQSVSHLPVDMNIKYPTFESSRYGNPLAIHMAALASILAPDFDPDVRRPEQIIIEHEQRYWQSAALAANLEIHPVTQRRAVMGSCLYGAEFEREAVKVISILPNMETSHGDLNLRIAFWLRDLYPAEHATSHSVKTTSSNSSFWGTLEPDVLAEYLVGQDVGQDPEVVQSTITQDLSNTQIRHALTVLSRAALSWPSIAEIMGAVVITSSRVRLQAIPVILEAEDATPILDGLRSIDLPSLSTQELTGLVEAIPSGTERLAHFALDARRVITDRLRVLLSEQPDSAERAKDLSVSLSDEAKRLRNVGRARQALLVQQEASQLTVRRGGTTDGVPVHIAADVYLDLAIALADAGRQDDALACVKQSLTLFNQISESDLTEYNLGFNYARAMHFAAIQLSTMGSYGEALKILTVLSSFLQAVPETDRDQVASEFLASVLHSQAIALRRTGRLEDAIDAEVDAETLLRKLTDEWYDGYATNLAQSLSFLGGCRVETGQLEAGILAIEEALNIYALACRQNPTAYLPGMLFCYYNLIRLLVSFSEMSSATDRVVRAYQELKGSHPNVYLPVLAFIHPDVSGTTRNILVVDQGTGRPETLDQADEAVSVYRRLCTNADRGFFGPLLASSLMELADFLQAEGRTAEALEASREGASLLEGDFSEMDLFEQHGVMVARASRAQRLVDSGRYLEALPLSRELFSHSSASTNPGLKVQAAFALIRCCRNSGSLTEAAEIAEQLVELLKQVRLGPWTCLSAEAERILVQTMLGHAENVYSEACQLAERVGTVAPQSELEEIENIEKVPAFIFNVAFHCAKRIGMLGEALRFAEQTVADLQVREGCRDEAAVAQVNVCDLLERLGQRSRAEQMIPGIRADLEMADNYIGLFGLLDIVARLRQCDQNFVGAVQAATEGLQYSYKAGEISNLAAAHFHLAMHWTTVADSRRQAAAHFIAAGLIESLIDSADVEHTLRTAGEVLASSSVASVLPVSLDELCTYIAQISSVDVGKVLGTLVNSSKPAAEEKLRNILSRLRGLISNSLEVHRWMAMWDPFIAGLLAERKGIARASDLLDSALSMYAENVDWQALIYVLSEIRRRAISIRLVSLDEIDKAIIKKCNSVLAGEVHLPDALWPAMGYAGWLADIVAATLGITTSSQDAQHHISEFSARGMENMSQALSRIVRGERSAELTEGLQDPVARAVVSTVLYHVNGAAEK